LVGQLYQKYGDLIKARDNAIIMGRGYASDKAQEKMSLANNDVVTGKAMQLMGQLKAQNDYAIANRPDDPVMQGIQRLPSDIKKDALEEYGIHKKYIANSNEIENMRREAKEEQRLMSLHPLEVSEKQARTKASVITMLNDIKKGGYKLSEQTIKNLVDPYMPARYESDKEIDESFDKLQELMARNADVSTLSGYGLIENPTKKIATSSRVQNMESKPDLVNYKKQGASVQPAMYEPKSVRR
jgi:hypothetical protein